MYQFHFDIISSKKISLEYVLKMLNISYCSTLARIWSIMTNSLLRRHAYLMCLNNKFYLISFYLTRASTSWILSMIFPCMSFCCWDICLMAAVAFWSSEDRRAIDVSHLTILPRRSVREATWWTSRFFTALFVPKETLSRWRILSSSC